MITNVKTSIKPPDPPKPEPKHKLYIKKVGTYIRTVVIVKSAEPRTGLIVRSEDQDFQLQVWDTMTLKTNFKNHKDWTPYNGKLTIHVENE